MAFRRPALFTTIDPQKYEDQINVNFSKIDESFVAIQNDIAVLLGQQTTSYSNLAFVDKLLLPNGPVGHDSFELDWQQGTDGDWSVQLNRSTPDGVQQAVVQNLLHEFPSNDRPILDVSAVAPNGDGPHRMIIGLSSEGAPQMRASVVSNEQPFSTDTEDTDFVDLVLYEFEYSVETDGPLIRNVRRVAQPVISNTAFQRHENMVETLELRIPGILQADDSDAPNYFIMPYDCEVVEASAMLNIGPQDNENVEVALFRFGWTEFTANDRAENVLRRSFIWGADTDAGPAVQDDASSSDGVQVVPGPAEGLVQLDKDDYINLRFIQTDGIISGNFTDAQASGLTIQLRIRRISHDSRRYPE